jgi:hypothetical protein
MPSAVEEQVMACGFTEEEIMAVQKKAATPYTDADALLSAVLQSEVEVEEELRHLTGAGRNKELQEALRMLAETDVEVEAAQAKVEELKKDGLEQWGPEALEENGEESEQHSESDDELDGEDVVKTEGFKHESPAASPAESPERSGESQGPPVQLNRDKVEKAGFDMGEVEKLCAMLGMDAGKTKQVAGDIAAANEKEPAALAPEPEADSETPTSLVAGDRVEIGGLTGAPQHNGKEGVVVRWVKAKRRYIVEVDGLPKPLAVRPANLQICLGGSHTNKSQQAGEAGEARETSYVLQGFKEPVKKKHGKATDATAGATAT